MGSQIGGLELEVFLKTYRSKKLMIRNHIWDIGGHVWVLENELVVQ
jgi:hypothetical protein